MTTIGIACGQLQSFLKFRSSLFKGLWGAGRSPGKRLAECEAEPHEKKPWRGSGRRPEKTSFFTEIIKVKQAIADFISTEIKSCCITFKC